jgi:hypothetical protein
MKTLVNKGLAILGIGVVMFGIAAVSPALADGRHDDNCGRPGIQIIFNGSDRYVGHDNGRDNDRRDRDDHRGDRR